MIRAKLPIMGEEGRSWRQPQGLRDRVGIYETHATISETDWHGLPRYESSYPTGCYPGKVWRRGPWLCWYGHDRKIVEYGREKVVCKIGYLRALVVGDGTNITYRPAR